MAKARRHAEDRLLGTAHGRAAGSDLPDLSEDDVFSALESGWSLTDPGRSRCEGEGEDRGASLPPVASAVMSAPVEVPAWTRLHRVEDEEEAEFGGWMPPHEYLARAKGRSGGTTRSVLEGAGRTLKGRDMSRVRDAVWNRTGFYG
ncbi:uncharacterized protein LOC122026599 [Zingiber officinale]|uniref:Senescence regulator n=1 Tax=Zingiber officinale TaxID=94328 RepID=A0A8J5ERE6_ZINOF|nr:uncharacterized protein LOC122026599 [Zingiber officinale]KAG6473942.1 hypothetical protein ZIOFF_067862 [Zingiber officinale]